MSYISANRFLTFEEMTENATFVYQYLLSYGWTPSAICGVLGNMQTESTINPGIWQNLDAGNLSLGYGLVQWTPATKYLDWCDERSLVYGLMESNLARIFYEVEFNIQWIYSEMTFYEFTQFTGTPYDAAVLFLHKYERPAEPNDQQRGGQAEYWYNLLSGLPPVTPGGGQSYNRRNLPLLRYIRPRRRRY